MYFSFAKLPLLEVNSSSHFVIQRTWPPIEMWNWIYMELPSFRMINDINYFNFCWLSFKLLWYLVGNAYCAFHVLVQTSFQRYYFYSLPDQSQILLDHFNVSNFTWIRQQMKNFPIDPHFKNCPLCNGGLWGNSLPLLDLNEIWHQSSSKTFQWSRWVWAWSGKK